MTMLTLWMLSGKERQGEGIQLGMLSRMGIQREGSETKTPTRAEGTVADMGEAPPPPEQALCYGSGRIFL